MFKKEYYFFFLLGEEKRDNIIKGEMEMGEGEGEIKHRRKSVIE